MGAYFDYLKESLQEFFGGLFSGNFDSAKLGEMLAQNSSNFGAVGWIFFVLFIIFAVALVVCLILLAIYLIKRLLKRRKKGMTEEKMMEEIERLNLELFDVTREKDRILGLHREAEGLPNVDNSLGDKKGKEAIKGGPRFTKLDLVDQKYNYEILNVEVPEDGANLSLKDICERFRNFACSQMKLYYTIDTVREAFAAMGTGKLIILEGISGTGKTSLPYCLGRFFKHNAAICSVQPSWRDRNELLGFYNDFTKKFTETEFLRAVYEATYRNDCNFIVLDEMNLARVEYYFAEFLSIMEMPNVQEWIIDVIASPREDDPRHLHEGKLLIPQNIWFFGTANNDDSTFTITDKVYDRASSLFFENKSQPFEAPFTEALGLPAENLIALYDKAKADYKISEDTLAKFASLDEYVIEHFKLAFGNRIMKQINAFVPCYVACGGTELEAIDFIFKTKILKKFEVLNVAFLRDELVGLDEQLTKLFGKNEFPLSRDKIKTLIKMSR
ncbi:MAG: hypothetical protein SPL02_03165 [Bacilli bacterium]|nr:hypothetical protein [Bacilli bacterium]MDY6430898.1 hypothetical protein [Bacilli bacterium]